MHVRTVAAIIVWFVVALLLLNRLLRYDWITPFAIVLTVIAIFVYFSPRLMKRKKQTTIEEQTIVAS
ncbi:MAG: hypothetical protein NWF06_02135 [Candidatus Bathyarchaeota archaeon]|nr:hypothetical protein [Candidatus Bathyarchaeum sp.]